MMKLLKRGKLLVFCALLCLLLATVASAAGSGDVASAVESTWTTYFDYRKSGQFEWTAPAILFACLVFTLTAPTYIWGIVGL